MGFYTEYLSRQMTPEQLDQERKAQLQSIAKHRDRDVLVIAADLMRARANPGINYSDLLPIRDQLDNLTGSEAIDLILETPGGSGETAEEIVGLLRGRYKRVGVIVPGTAKSAGTIIAMAADEILMEPGSSLGPIDAQISWQGKTFSAHALLEQMDKIKAEVLATGQLNRAYIPILQGISPGELQHAKHALDFARDLVRDWLNAFKFREWKTHSSTGLPVTDEDRLARATEIADKLCDHSHWKTHGRSIKIEDLRAMRLLITNYADDRKLWESVRRYYTLMRMMFDGAIYKAFETQHDKSQIFRFERQDKQGIPVVVPGNPPQGLKGAAQAKAIGADLTATCKQCSRMHVLQANFEPGVPAQPGRIPFPADNRLTCPCGNVIDLAQARRQLEAQVGRPIVVDGANA